MQNNSPQVFKAPGSYLFIIWEKGLFMAVKVNIFAHSQPKLYLTLLDNYIN